jgi:hypothetical protein
LDYRHVWKTCAFHNALQAAGARSGEYGGGTSFCFPA